MQTHVLRQSMGAATLRDSKLPAAWYANFWQNRIDQHICTSVQNAERIAVKLCVRTNESMQIAPFSVSLVRIRIKLTLGWPAIAIVQFFHAIASLTAVYGIRSSPLSYPFLFSSCQHRVQFGVLVCVSAGVRSKHIFPALLRAPFHLV